MLITTGTCKAPIKVWQNTNQELFKVKYIIKFSQYFGNTAKAVIKVTQQNTIKQSFQSIG